VKLTEHEIEDALKKLPDWQREGDTLRREFQFKNFLDAFAFMTKVAICAEKIDHHPDWSNSYNKVVISLTTHDVGGLSPRDLALAEAINREAP
ncbi:MAG: 4a-hydroxytetrahydrobiopterin dehydratase, partial [Spongiibacter sp.]|nr:4a-hydroxytetrahydrobiopterin dehydratase [Spongiibacter sp.]